MINKINLAKAFFKRHWYKFLSVLCVAAVVFTTSFASSVTYAVDTPPFSSTSPYDFNSDGWQSAPTNLRLLADAFVSTLKSKSASDFFIGTIYDIPHAWVNLINDSAFLYGYTICPYDDVYYYLNNDGVLCLYDPHHRTGSSGGGGINRHVTYADDFVFNSSFFRDRVNYWSDYYKPKDNPSQYVYSYNDGNSTKSYTPSPFGYSDFSPYCPVYTSSSGSSTGWGFKGWSSGGVYILPFVDDDDLSFVYYGKYCFHIYTTQVDGVVTIFFDIIDLTDGSIYASRQSAWDSAYDTIALNLASKPFLYHYTSYFNYRSNATGTDGTWFLNVNTDVPLTMCSGLVSSLTSSNLTTLRCSGTFDPVNNSSDDFGYILSSEPFILWGAQTDIDTSKIPDDYIVTVTGDTVYDYSITNTSGDTTTINNYITNNYTVPETEKPDSGGSSAIGDITVSGDIGINGQVDINVNVNNSIPSYDDYVDSLPNKSDTLSDYLKVFFDFLPAELLSLILGGVATAIICSIFRR